MSENDTPGPDSATQETPKTAEKPSGAAGVFTSRNLVLAAMAALIALGAFAFGTSGAVDGNGAPAGPDGETPVAEQPADDEDARPVDPDDERDRDEDADSGDAPPKRTPSGEKAPGDRTPTVAENGAQLDKVTSAPPKTLSRMKMPEGLKEGGYTMVFKPFGWAPDAPEGRRLVVQVVEAEASDARLQDLANRNMLLIVASYNGDKIETGGTYRGRVEVRVDDEGRGAFFLREATPAR